MISPERDYSEWTREQLVSRINDLEAQLGNNSTTADCKDQNADDLDFSKHAARHISLKVAYFGWDSAGSRCYNPTALPAVGDELLRAMLMSRLIPRNTKACCLSMCGRTDKGVSALSQVFSVWIRTNSPLGTQGTLPWSDLISKPGTYVRCKILKDGVYDTREKRTLCPSTGAPFEIYDKVKNEIPYIGLINKFLPKVVHVWAWCPVSASFSARYTCFSRQYGYFFPGCSLNIAWMREACKAFEGDHNFANYCKIDPRKPPKLLDRSIIKSDILAANFANNQVSSSYNFEPVDEYINESGEAKDSSQMFVFFVESHGFLWNQVRRMVYTLFMVGSGYLPANVVSDTLKEKRSRSLPFDHAYNSPPYPLVFMDGIYPEYAQLNWNYASNADSNTKGCFLIEKYLYQKLEDLLYEQLIRTTHVRMLSSHLEPLYLHRSPQESGTKKKRVANKKFSFARIK